MKVPKIQTVCGFGCGSSLMLRMNIEAIAKKALAAGIEDVVFDRGGYIYTGRVKELADGAREAGLKF